MNVRIKKESTSVQSLTSCEPTVSHCKSLRMARWLPNLELSLARLIETSERQLNCEPTNLQSFYFDAWMSTGERFTR